MSGGISHVATQLDVQGRTCLPAGRNPPCQPFFGLCGIYEIFPQQLSRLCYKMSLYHSPYEEIRETVK